MTELAPDRLAAVMAYCTAHPYDGPEPDVQPLYVEQRYDYDTDMRTAWTRDVVPKFIDIAAFFLEDDDSIVRFEDDAVVFPVQPHTLRYRPLYVRYASRTIVLQRIDEEAV